MRLVINEQHYSEYLPAKVCWLIHGCCDFLRRYVHVHWSIIDDIDPEPTDNEIIDAILTKVAKVNKE